MSAYRGDNVETGALGAFLDATKKGIVEPGSFLLVESLDRVSRKVAVRILEDIVESGVTVVTLNDGKQYTAESLDGFDFVMAVLILIRADQGGRDEGAAAQGGLAREAAAGEVGGVDGSHTRLDRT